jgi:hypothetical protein
MPSLVVVVDLFYLLSNYRKLIIRKLYKNIKKIIEE